MFQLEVANQFQLVGAIAKRLKSNYPQDKFAWEEILRLIYHYQDEERQFFLNGFVFAEPNERAHLSLQFSLPEPQVKIYPDGTQFSFVEHCVLING